MKTQSINTVQAKNEFNKIVAKVRATHVPVIVEKRGEPVAVILDYESYQAGEGSVGAPRDTKNTLLSDFNSWHAHLKTQSKDTTDAAEILRELRDERSKKYE